MIHRAELQTSMCSDLIMCSLARRRRRSKQGFQPDPTAHQTTMATPSVQALVVALLIAVASVQVAHGESFVQRDLAWA
jgi:hypothetical protein